MSRPTPTICIVGHLVGRKPGLVTTQGQILADLFHEAGYRVICASSEINRVKRLLDIVATLLRTRRTSDVVIVEIYSGLSFVVADVASLTAKYLGLPCVGVLHGGDLPRFARSYPRWISRVLSRFTKLVAPSKFLAQALATPAVQIIPNVVDIEEYPYRPLRSVSPRLLWMRAFHDLYNPQLAVRAFSKIKGKYRDAVMVMAGVDKGLEPKIKQMARDLGLEDAIRFPGFLDHDAKIREFSAADIFLNTNRIDNTPVAVIEACAMGLAVVATRVGGVPDLIRDGETGLLVKDDDDEGMANAVELLLHDPEQVERMSRNGRTLAENSSWKNVHAKWQELFEALQPMLRERAIDLPNRPVSNL